MTLQKVDVLAIGAHPDDLELSCGGTIASLVAGGKRVGMIDLTRGEMGTRGTAEVREREANRAAEILGAAFRLQLDFGDGGLRTGRAEELELIRVFRATSPSLIVAAYPDDRHPDHRRGGELVTDAWFYAGLRSLDVGLPAHRAQSVVYYLLNYPVTPTFIVDVTKHHETKRRAMLAFESQFHREGSDEPMTMIAQKSFLEMIEGRARHFGAFIGAEFGEAFWSKTPPRVEDPIAAFSGREVS